MIVRLLGYAILRRKSAAIYRRRGLSRRGTPLMVFDGSAIVAATKRQFDARTTLTYGFNWKELPNFLLEPPHLGLPNLFLISLEWPPLV